MAGRSDRCQVELLREHRRLQLLEKMRERLDYADNGLVFASALGTPIENDKVKRAWSKVADDAGLPEVTFHDLRHTHASLMLAAGVNLKVVQERLGHSTISTTADVYSHVAPSIQAEAVRRYREYRHG